jgi:hypothetical protein
MMDGGEQEWWYALPDDGQVFPEQLIGAVWSYLQWSGVDHLRPRSETQLANLIYPAFQASLCSEEGRQVRLRVAFNPKPKRFTVRFGEPLPYTAGQLVKLAPIIGLESRWVVALPDEGSKDCVRLAGILDPDILPIDRTSRHGSNGLLYYQNQFHGLRITVLGPGWIRVSIDDESFDLRNCCLRQRLVVGRIQYVAAWFREITSWLGIKDVRVGEGLIRRLIVNVLAKVSEARHGGCLLVLPNQIDLSSLPLKIKYRLDSDIIQTALKERASVEPSHVIQARRSGGVGPLHPAHLSLDDWPLADSLLLDRDLAQVIDFVAALAAVDGAILLARDLKLRGFGAEITYGRVPSGEEQVEYDNHPEPLGTPAPVSLSDFGMRHRSAIRFCQEVPGAMAFVISQDGGIRMFHNVDGRVRQWVELSAEEW